MRLLLIEDDTAYRYTFQRQLEDKGCEVLAFGNAWDALDAVDRGEKFDFLVTDILLPDGQPHGVSAALMIRRKRHDLPVAFLTENPEFMNTALINNLGPVFMKPVDPDAVYSLAVSLSGASASP